MHSRGCDKQVDYNVYIFQVCRERGIDCIVAPYEADAQLAFLNKAGIAQVIVTEDSDLLLFGCDRVCKIKILKGEAWV